MLKKSKKQDSQHFYLTIWPRVIIRNTEYNDEKAGQSKMKLTVMKNDRIIIFKQCNSVLQKVGNFYYRQLADSQMEIDGKFNNQWGNQMIEIFLEYKGQSENQVSFTVQPCEYILKYKLSKQNRFSETAVISENSQIQFELIVGKTSLELKKIISEVKIESRVKTPMVLQNKVESEIYEKGIDDDEIDSILGEFGGVDHEYIECQFDGKRKLMQSQHFENQNQYNFKKNSSLDVKNQIRMSQDVLKKIKQQEQRQDFRKQEEQKEQDDIFQLSLNDIPGIEDETTPQFKKFSISTCQLVPKKSYMKEYGFMATYIFISSLMIYFSMLPVKRI